MPDSPSKILIIEDDAVTRLTLVKVLVRSGYEVIEAHNGREGLGAYMEHHPHLVLMDVMMPVMDGFDSTRAIREYEHKRAVPILMLTALDDIDSIDDAFHAGATDFITKPINWGIFVQRVKYALRTAQIEDKLRMRQAELDFAQKLAKLGYWEWDIAKDQVIGSTAVFNIFDVPMTEKTSLKQFLSNVIEKDRPILQQAILEANQGQTKIQVSFRVVSHDGSIKHIECLGEVEFAQNGELIKITGSAQDISRLHRAESQIEYQNTHDSLTSLPNRNHFIKTLKTQLQEYPKRLCAVIVFDIDRFKQINTHFGQDFGDELLTAIAQRLNRITRDGDYVARIGSDEFSIVVVNLTTLNELNHLANRLHHSLKTAFVINQTEIFLSLSSGIATFPDDGKDANSLLNNANIARAKAKAEGGNQQLFFRCEMNQAAQESMQMENELRNALRLQQIEVYYQPQVDANTLAPVGAEALVRWKHPQFGLVSPAVFIPLAESTGLITEIGNFVMREAVKQTYQWYQQGHNLRIGINLSSRQFTQSNLMKEVQELLSSNDLPSELIDLEITESLAMSDAESTAHILNGLKAMGVSISIDDFGTGYSSLAYLHSFPIDTIKIDRCFVQNLNTQAGQAIANTIIAMAKSLDLEVIAEGIELTEQIDYLQARHCDILQGFKFGKPMPAREFEQWLREQPKKSAATNSVAENSTRQ
ncbi:diguanylate cyclase [uncultured Thiomicrorhabdus sp.]